MVEHRSLHLGKKAAQTLYYAVGEQAERIGQPLTHLITINFSMTAVEPQNATKAFQKFRLSYFNKWATRPCLGAGAAFTPAYAYCFENERDGVAFDTIESGASHNVHVHWLAHIPPARFHDFEMRVWGWLDAIAGRVSPAGVIKIDPIFHDKGLRRYVLKGTSHPWAARFGTSYAPQGLIVGRRSGTSINLGRSAKTPSVRRARARACRVRLKRPRPITSQADSAKLKRRARPKTRKLSCSITARARRPAAGVGFSKFSRNLSRMPTKPTPAKKRAERVAEPQFLAEGINCVFERYGVEERISVASGRHD